MTTPGRYPWRYFVEEISNQVPGRAALTGVVAVEEDGVKADPPGAVEAEAAASGSVDGGGRSP